jgi:hypothetical protein
VSRGTVRDKKTPGILTKSAQVAENKEQESEKERQESSRVRK